MNLFIAKCGRCQQEEGRVGSLFCWFCGLQMRDKQTGEPLPHSLKVESVDRKERTINLVYGPMIEIAPCYLKTRGRGVVYSKDLSYVECNERILNPDRLMTSQRILVEED